MDEYQLKEELIARELLIRELEGKIEDLQRQLDNNKKWVIEIKEQLEGKEAVKNEASMS